MNSTETPKIRMPLGLMIATIYLIISGAIGLILTFTGLGPDYSGFETKSLAYKFGSYLRVYLFDCVAIISGIGILLKKSWARKTALMIIVLNAIYASNSFAWGFARGKPSFVIYLLSFALIGAWSAIWFFLIFKKSSTDALSRKN